MNRRAAHRALYGALFTACLAATAGCGEATGSDPAEAAVPAESPLAPLPSQVGKSLPDALDAAVNAHYGYGLSEANGKGQLRRVTPDEWKVCFQKPGPLGDAVIFGVVRAQETCPSRWIDKL